jgi:hypothetical protein
MPWASAVPSAGAGQAAKHGEVLGCEPDGVQVATVVGSLVMTSMSDPGSPPKPTAAWTPRQQVACGSQLPPVDPATARRHSAWVPHQPEAR